jgi:chitosanase
MISDTQKRTAQAIVNIFETGSAVGDYGKVTLLPDDPGHLTYGRSQTTLASGNLFLLLKQYVEALHAEFADAFRPYLPRVQARDLALDNDSPLRALLHQAGGDTVMRDVQDDFFDRAYWIPAQTATQALNIATPLGHCVVYDSTVHGSFGLIRDRTKDAVGTIGGEGVTEQVWIARYIATRRDWLANHSIQLLRKTAYRMDALQQLVDANNWDLTLPLTVRGVLINETALDSQPEGAAAEVTRARVLRLATPMMRGDDVVQLQRALASRVPRGLDADGIFGLATDRALREFQAAQHLTVDGIAGPATRAALKI